jgi:hypothetical protein
MNKQFFSLAFFAFTLQLAFAQNEVSASVEHKTTFIASTPKSIPENPVSLNRASYNAGSSVQMSVNINRLLDHPKGAFSVKVYFSSDPNFDFGDELLENFNFEELTTDSKSHLPISVTLPNDISIGQYTFLIVAQTEEGVLLSRTSTAKVLVSESQSR